MPTPSTSFDPRLNQLHDWLQQKCQLDNFVIQPITNDASFRRYFRITCKTQTLVAMDAPPDKENIEIFANKALVFQKLHLQVPKILAHDTENGFLLLSDLGDDLYLQIVNQNNFTSLYNLALTELDKIQTYVPHDFSVIPHYDEKILLRELQLFPTWYLADKNQILSTVELDKIFKLLIDSALNQPQVLVHRDYHSRNLLLLPDKQLGIIDFQDAVFGPITYDLVSLLRDCYITWSEDTITALVHQFYHARKLKNVAAEEFMRWFDWMGLQRHLKVLGLFTRLAVRDHKPGYLQHMPRVLNYVRTISKKYQEFAKLNEILG